MGVGPRMLLPLVRLFAFFGTNRHCVVTTKKVGFFLVLYVACTLPKLRRPALVHRRCVENLAQYHNFLPIVTCFHEIFLEFPLFFFFLRRHIVPLEQSGVVVVIIIVIIIAIHNVC
jgi:hypothetical protein